MSLQSTVLHWYTNNNNNFIIVIITIISIYSLHCSVHRSSSSRGDPDRGVQ